MVCSPQAEASGEGEVGLRPVLMDFGLARDSLGPQRLTQTGVIMGTPHYMAPEQARGQARHLDRRADVYSLGAILYEMLTGRPPFDAEHEVDLLLAVLHQDPPPPRQLEPSVPFDLEVITLKCLRKEPEHRYDSALALAEDLQRYLRSEPIQARPASTLYRIRRLAMRHRALFAVAAVLLLSLCSVVGVALHSRQGERRAAVRADERQRLAAELGQTMTKLKLFLRIAYSLPPHPLHHEQELARDHLRKLQAQEAGADPFLHGTLEMAIGQGHMTLGEHELAVKHLLRAVELGERTAGAHLALGQALGLLYEQRAAQISRSNLPEQAKPELAKLRQEMLGRTRQELTLGQATELASPSYVRALVHFYGDVPEAEYDAALIETRQAQREATWLLEPFDLELKITMQRYTEGIRHGKSPTAAESAAVHDALERAINIARSYPEFYSHFTDYTIYREKDMLLASGDVKEADSLFAEAIPHARTAIVLQPDSGVVRDQLMDLYASWAYSLGWRHQSPTAVRDAGLAASVEALRIPPERARTYEARSRLHLAQMMYQESIGEDSQTVTEQAVADARQALRLEPKNADIGNILGVSLSVLTQLKRSKGIPTGEDAKELLAVGQRAVDLRPGIPLPLNNLASMYLEVAYDHVKHGNDPSAELQKARPLIQQLRSQHPDFLLGVVAELNLEHVEIAALLQTGHDVTERTQKLLAQTQEALKLHPHYAYLQQQLGDCYLTLLDSLMRYPGSVSPGSIIDEGLAPLPDFAQSGLGPAKAQLLRADLLLRKASWMRDGKQSPEPILTDLLQRLDGQSAKGGVQQSELGRVRARALRIRAEWLRDQGKRAQALATVEAGLATCAKSEQSGPAAGYLIRPEMGALLSLKAQLTRAPAERTQLADQAVSILSEVVKKRPPLKHEFEGYLKGAQTLTAKG